MSIIVTVLRNGRTRRTKTDKTFYQADEAVLSDEWGKSDQLPGRGDDDGGWRKGLEGAQGGGVVKEGRGRNGTEGRWEGKWEVGNGIGTGETRTYPTCSSSAETACLVLVLDVLLLATCSSCWVQSICKCVILFFSLGSAGRQDVNAAGHAPI